MLELILVRHAATAFNAERRYQGRVDPPLSEGGAARAASLRASLARRHVATATAAVHSGDSRRALETAALALPGAAVRRDARLRELDFGAFDGLTYEENLAAHGDAFRAWVADPAAASPPDGESLAALEARVAEWLDSLPPAGRVVAFTHGGPIHALLARLRRVPFAEARRVRVAPGDALRLLVPPVPGSPAPAPIRPGERCIGPRPGIEP